MSMPVSRSQGALLLLGVSLLAGDIALPAAQSPAAAPAAPAIYKSAADIAAGLGALGASSTTAATGADVSIAPNISVRRRSSGGEPQFAIIHPFSVEVYQIMEGTATLVTGGTLNPPINEASPDIVRSQSIAGGTAQKVGKGDVVVINPGTPHWFSQIDGSVTYLEARIRVK